MDKFGIQVNYNKDSTSFQINKESNLDKLFKFIEIYYEEIKGTNYQILYNDINLKKKNSLDKLNSVFINEDPNNDIIINLINYDEGKHPNFKIQFDCLFEKTKKSFLINPSLTFQNFKYNLLATFPKLEEDNYMIIYKDEDITNIYPNEKLIKEVFNIDLSSTNSLNNIIEIELQNKLKTIIEYFKRCSFCFEEKASNICKKCSIASCEKCNKKDEHFKKKKTEFIPIIKFKDYELSTLNYIIQKILETKSINEKLNSDNLNHFFEEKINLIKSKFVNNPNEEIELRDIPVNNLKRILDSINNKYHPEDLTNIITNLYNLVLNYKNNPFYDCEESMKKINELLKELEILLSNFKEYNLLYDEFYDKYKKCMDINTNLEIELEELLIDSKLIFEKGYYLNKYNKLMKIYDNSRVLVFNYSTLRFNLMNFLDYKEQFKDNLNNFIQVNYNYDNMEKIFLITGATSQKFYIYDYNTNEMQYIGMLKFSHNWWPSLIPVKIENKYKKQLFLFCLSGTYTNKCEVLIFKDEEIEGGIINELDKNDFQNEDYKNIQSPEKISEVKEEEKNEEIKEEEIKEEEKKEEEKKEEIEEKKTDTLIIEEKKEDVKEKEINFETQMNDFQEKNLKRSESQFEKLKKLMEERKLKKSNHPKNEKNNVHNEKSFEQEININKNKEIKDNIQEIHNINDNIQLDNNNLNVPINKDKNIKEKKENEIPFLNPNTNNFNLKKKFNPQEPTPHLINQEDKNEIQINNINDNLNYFNVNINDTENNNELLNNPKVNLPQEEDLKNKETEILKQELLKENEEIKIEKENEEKKEQELNININKIDNNIIRSKLILNEEKNYKEETINNNNIENKKTNNENPNNNIIDNLNNNINNNINIDVPNQSALLPNSNFNQSKIDHPIYNLKEKYKSLNEKIIALETELNITKKENEQYKKEIISLKENVSILKQQSSKSNEEILKVDLYKLKQTLKQKENEVQNLNTENTRLKNLLKLRQNEIEDMIKDNKLFREEAEKRFSSYQKEIENLRTSSLVNSNNNLFTNNIITPNINYKYDDNLKIEKNEIGFNNNNIYNRNENDFINGINNEGQDNDNYLNMNGNIYDETKINNNKNGDNNNEKDNDEFINDKIEIKEEIKIENNEKKNIIKEDKEEINIINEKESIIKKEKEEENKSLEQITLFEQKDKKNEKEEILNPFIEEKNDNNKEEKNIFDEEENEEEKQKKENNIFFQNPKQEIKRLNNQTKKNEENKKVIKNNPFNNKINEPIKKEITENNPFDDNNDKEDIFSNDNNNFIFDSKKNKNISNVKSNVTNFRSPNLKKPFIKNNIIDNEKKNNNIIKSKTETNLIKKNKNNNFLTQSKKKKENLFDEFEDDVDDDIFSKKDGVENIFESGNDKNKESSIFD